MSPSTVSTTRAIRTRTAKGYVDMPNVNLVDEMVDLITATRADEANVAVVNATKTLVARALDLGRG